MVVDRQSRPAGMRVAMREGAFTHKEEGDLWNNLARLVFVYFIPVCPTLLQCPQGVALLLAFGAGKEPGNNFTMYSFLCMCHSLGLYLCSHITICTYIILHSVRKFEFARMEEVCVVSNH